MEQQRLQKEEQRIQAERIREVEQVISLLEEENSLQKQLIEKLQEEAFKSGEKYIQKTGIPFKDAKKLLER